jgi:hypothetical protein
MDNQIISGLVAVTWRISGSTRDQRQTLRRHNCEANSLDKLSSIEGDGFVGAVNRLVMVVHVYPGKFDLHFVSR